MVADRYVDSTTAYQGYGRRLPLGDVEFANRMSSQRIMPQITFLLDAPPVEALDRVLVQPGLPLEASEPSYPGRIDREGARRFEEESPEFHERVREGYLELAGKEPERWRVVDATKPIEDIAAIVWDEVRDRLGPGHASDGPEGLELRSPTPDNSR